jgi:hypothetical protein
VVVWAERRALHKWKLKASGGRQVADPKCIFLWGFKIAFGGQRSTGFGVIYDSVDLAKQSLSKHLLMREGLKEKPKGAFPGRAPVSAAAAMPHAGCSRVLVRCSRVQGGLWVLKKCCGCGAYRQACAQGVQGEEEQGA